MVRQCVRMLLAGTLWVAGVAAVPSRQHRRMMDNRRSTRNHEGTTGADYPNARYVQQPQDHLDPANKKTWQQAYYVNDEYWAGSSSSSPIFLCVGGEGPPLDGSAVVNSVHCNVAVEWLRQQKALMFALEHRYYGCHNMSACPVDNFANQTTALQFLSSRQAIEDVAGFVTAMNRQYQLDSKHRWITWGGSYPGMLAGWSRLKHPDLIYASVASSAPVHAKLDMPEYNDAVANAYSVEHELVGGSLACEAAIRRGHELAGRLLLDKTGIQTLEALLKLPAGSLATREQQADVLGEGVADFPAQSNEPSCTEPACNIDKICQIMLNVSFGDELQRLAMVRSVQQSSVEHQHPLDILESRDDVPDFWFYQTCTEFGFYQTCEVGSRCMFVQGLVGLSDMASGCSAFGKSIADINRSIEATNEHYGGLRPTGPDSKSLGSCVLWPNGEVDPWATLSVLKSPGASQPVLWVPGASHHAWTHPSSPSDQSSVVKGRDSIRKQVEEWLRSGVCSTGHADKGHNIVV